MDETKQKHFRDLIHGSIQRLLSILTGLETTLHTPEQVIDEYAEAFLNFKASPDIGHQFEASIKSKLLCHLRSTACGDTSSQQLSVIDLDSSSGGSNSTDTAVNVVEQSTYVTSKSA